MDKRQYYLKMSSWVYQNCNLACNFEDELKTRLTKVYETVNENLKTIRDCMRQSYNKSIRFHSYTVGDKVWLHNKYYKPGENLKLAPQRSGPWSVIKILRNGRNFWLKKDMNVKNVIIHHDRIEAVQRSPMECNSFETESDSASSSSKKDNETDTVAEVDNESYR